MSIASITTFGFGSFGTIGLIVTIGYGAGSAAPPPSSDGGGGKKKHSSHLTKFEKEEAERIITKLEREVSKLKDAKKSKKRRSLQIATKAQEQIEEYRQELVKLDPQFSGMVDALLATLTVGRQSALDKAAKQRAKDEEDIKIIIMLLSSM